MPDPYYVSQQRSLSDAIDGVQWGGDSGWGQPQDSNNVSAQNALVPIENGLILIATAGSITLYDPVADQTVGSYSHNSNIRECRWSPSGTKFASGGYDSQLVVYDMTSDSIIAERGLSSNIRGLQWLTDGRLVYGNEGTAYVYDVENNSVIETVGTNYGPVAAGPTDTQFSYVNGPVTLYDYSSGSTIASSASLNEFATNSAWHPTGEAVVVGGHKGMTALIEYSNGAFGEPQYVGTGSDQVVDVRWEPSGNRFATITPWGDNRVRVYSYPDGSHVTTFPRTSDRGKALAWAPGGDKIVYASGSNPTYIREVDSETLVDEIGIQDVFGLDWRPAQ